MESRPVVGQWDSQSIVGAVSYRTILIFATTFDRCSQRRRCWAIKNVRFGNLTYDYPDFALFPLVGKDKLFLSPVLSVSLSTCLPVYLFTNLPKTLNFHLSHFKRLTDRISFSFSLVFQTVS